MQQNVVTSLGMSRLPILSLVTGAPAVASAVASAVAPAVAPRSGTNRLALQSSPGGIGAHRKVYSPAERGRMMPRKTRKQRGLQDEHGDGGGAVAFVSYHGPHQQTTAAARRTIHRQAMREIGKSRRKPRGARSVELDVVSLLRPGGGPGPLPAPPASWWLGVRWTLADGINTIASFTWDPDALEKRLVSNSE